MIGGWEKLHSWKLHSLYYYQDMGRKLRRMSWAVCAAGMGGNRTAYKILIREYEEERILERTRRMWKVNIKKSGL